MIPNICNLLDTFLNSFGEKVRQTNRRDWKIINDYLPKPIGKGCGLSYDRLDRILLHFQEGRNLQEYQQLEQFKALGLFFDKVKSINKSKCHVVDFTIPKSATFFANGFVNHNTTLALHAVAETQKKGGRAAFIDAEHALDPEYAKRIGVKVKDLIISQPDNGEEALNILESLVRSEIIDIVVVDSVAALTPKSEIEGEMGAHHVGTQARLMSQALRKLTAIASNTKTIIVFINQTRMKIGVSWGNPETTPGGLALKFYSSVRIEVRRAAQIKHGDEITGSRIRAKIVKNKVAAPFKTAESDIYYNEGISAAADFLNAGIKEGVVKKAGSWLQYETTKLGQGMEASKKFLQENPKIAKEIQGKLLS